jgi:hypothetical protein
MLKKSQINEYSDLCYLDSSNLIAMIFFSSGESGLPLDQTIMLEARGNELLWKFTILADGIVIHRTKDSPFLN